MTENSDNLPMPSSHVIIPLLSLSLNTVSHMAHHTDINFRNVGNFYFYYSNNSIVEVWNNPMLVVHCRIKFMINFLGLKIFYSACNMNLCSCECIMLTIKVFKQNAVLLQFDFEKQLQLFSHMRAAIVALRWRSWNGNRWHRIEWTKNLFFQERWPNQDIGCSLIESETDIVVSLLFHLFLKLFFLESMDAKN